MDEVEEEERGEGGGEGDLLAKVGTKLILHLMLVWVTHFGNHLMFNFL